MIPAARSMIVFACGMHHDTLGKHRKVAGQVPGEVLGRFRKVPGGSCAGCYRVSGGFGTGSGRFRQVRKVPAGSGTGCGRLWRRRYTNAQNPNGNLSHTEPKPARNLPEPLRTESLAEPSGTRPGASQNLRASSRTFQNPPGTHL